jgi:carbamoyl-phosphate synthase large subunit
MTDRTMLVPLTAEGDAWCAAIARLVEEEQPDLVLNGRDEELGLLGRLRAENRLPRTRYLVPPLGADDLFNDKYQTFRFALEHDLPFVDTASSSDEIEALLDRCGLPLVVKPRYASTGTRGVSLACTLDQLHVARCRREVGWNLVA